MDMDASTSQATWEFKNNIQLTDEIYTYDKKKHIDILSQKPWSLNANYFEDVKVSALSLLKMVIHAKSGGNIEIMGLLLGKVIGRTMIIMDTFALPVEGTETRVNAQSEAYEYMAEYSELVKKAGRLECVIGWYHSHPGYGCWLSGIDVNTQMLNQQFQEPFVAIVIDPIRTISAGQVNIGAFRTYPKNYVPVENEPSEYQSIPLDKIKDFGVHCKQYYSLEISYFKSNLDKKLLSILWNKYWVNTLSSNSLLINTKYISGQLSDIEGKLDLANQQLPNLTSFPSLKKIPAYNKYKTDMHLGLTMLDETKLSKVTKDCCRNSSELLHSIMAQIMKLSLFNGKIHYQNRISESECMCELDEDNKESSNSDSDNVDMVEDNLMDITEYSMTTNDVIMD